MAVQDGQELTQKLNSMRFLESHNVIYEVATFDSEIHDASDVASTIGVPASMVYKTLVVQPGDGGKPLLVMVAADRRLDLKKLAASTGHKKVSMAAHAEAERLTGLKVGGISALALVQKRWSVYLDTPAAALSHIYISAGQRGINLKVPVEELIRVLNVQVIEASGESDTAPDTSPDTGQKP